MLKSAAEIHTFYDLEFFPWEGLPYPLEHARLGIERAQAGDLEGARELAYFQQATLDHRLKPIFSFFRQEKGAPYAALEEANHLFFDLIKDQPEKEYHFVDPKLGIVSHRKENLTMLSLGSGCKSGMGAFLLGDYGVLNFGPQLPPLGDCKGFGLAGRGQKIEASPSTLRYLCRLAAPHERDTGIPWIEDSGYSGSWVETLCDFGEDSLEVECAIKGYRSLCDYIFVFFIKAQACFVAGSHKLNPCSLDCYQGPAQSITMHGVTLTPEGGFDSMEVRPLAGDVHCWGADFLVSLAINPSKSQRFTIKKISY